VSNGCGKFQITCAHVQPRVQGNPGKHTNLGFLGGLADGRGVYWPLKRSSWIANALEKFAARPRPVFAKFEMSRRFRASNMNLKKGPPSPRPRQRFRPRFSDLLFHQQPWMDPWVKKATRIRIRKIALNNQGWSRKIIPGPSHTRWDYQTPVTYGSTIPMLPQGTVPIIR
jgi:hypothetical protein